MPAASSARAIGWKRWIAQWSVDEPSTRFRVLAFILAFVVLVVGITSHAMWRDEIQAWLIVRDSHSLGDLLHNLRYEGHPALWYLVLEPLSALGRQPQWLKVAQGVCASAMIAIILWRGPFSRIEILLLPFTVALLFDYGIKSRSYALGIFLLMLFCATYRHRRTRPIVCAVVLALLVNVHAHFFIIGCACLGPVLFDRLRPSSPQPRFSRQDIPAAGIVLLGLLAAVATAWPPSDSGYGVGWQVDLESSHVEQTFMTLSDLLALRFDRFPGSSQVSAWLGLVLMVFVLVRWRRSPEATIFFVLSMSGLIFFFHAKYVSYYHGGGLLFVILIASIWLSRTTATMQSSSGLLPRALFGAVICAQAIHGLTLAVSDAFDRPYSNGYAIADFVDRKGWSGLPIFTTSDAIGSTVLGYLGADQFYYAQGARRGSFVIWDEKRAAPVDFAAFLRVVSQSNVAPVLLDCILSKNNVDPATHGFRLEATFAGSASGEDCTVYRRESD